MPWTFSPSAWLCGSYRLSVLCIVAVVFLPFRKTEVIWFDFLPLKHLFAEFPSHKGAVNFFFKKKVYSTISNWHFLKCQDFWPQNQNLSSSTCKGCEARVTLICWILPETGRSICPADAKSPGGGSDPLLLTQQLLYSSSSSCPLRSASGDTTLRSKIVEDVRTWEKMSHSQLKTRDCVDKPRSPNMKCPRCYLYLVLGLGMHLKALEIWPLPLITFQPLNTPLPFWQGTDN